MTLSRATGWSTFPLDVLDPCEMEEADHLATKTTPMRSLMENAGEAVAKAVLGLCPHRGKIVVACGPGNNGGDGYVAARLLSEAGCSVTIVGLVARELLAGVAASAASRWTGCVMTPDAIALDDVDVVVDALFGAGLLRDIDGAAERLIGSINAWSRVTGRPVLAVDVPSGIDGASGQVRGCAIQASDTITFFRLKPGHILLPGRIRCGTLALADIGISEAVLSTIGAQTFLNIPPLWRAAFPIPTLAGHKYSRGHALVVSGPVAQTGAARLCARGALRAGAGLVTVATPAEALQIHAAALTAIMTQVADGPAALADVLADSRKTAICLGPGLGVGETTRAMVSASLASARPSEDRPSRAIVLDADALVSFAEDPHALFAAIKSSEHAVILTPHDGEFAKLFGTLLDMAKGKLARTREAARLAHAVVVLKGPDTTVASPNGRASIAASDAPWLATAGSGDVLAGMITGLLAQGMPAFAAASAAVWMHAEAGRLFGPGLISEDIPEMLPLMLRDLIRDGQS